jgi:hypothetical protein
MAAFRLPHEDDHFGVFEIPSLVAGALGDGARLPKSLVVIGQRPPLGA